MVCLSFASFPSWAQNSTVRLSSRASATCARLTFLFETFSATLYWSRDNITASINALAVCIEMVFFSIAMIWAYPVSPYKAKSGRKTSIGRPILDSLNMSTYFPVFPCHCSSNVSSPSVIIADMTSSRHPEGDLGLAQVFLGLHTEQTEDSDTEEGQVFAKSGV